MEEIRKKNRFEDKTFFNLSEFLTFFPDKIIFHLVMDSIIYWYFLIHKKIQRNLEAFRDEKRLNINYFLYKIFLSRKEFLNIVYKKI
jgi:hypothetical protein